MSASEPPNLEAMGGNSPNLPGTVSETPALPANWLPQPTPAASVQRSASADVIQSIGRYRVERRLGQGGFGEVYLALDEELNRRVAIKVPRRLAASQVAEYREEAQKLARLEHPGVVPIHDIGHTTEFPVFLVTKFIEGGTLSEWVQRERPDFLTVVRVIAEVAEALHATHLKGIFHRDIKPANILVDQHGKPFLADFGLALKEGHGQDIALGILGTPAYMSPEQAAGEGHRVDGQTDIFSLGVVLYELLAGMRPFRASEKLTPDEQKSQLLEYVKTLDPRPPRQINDRVPKELERICLKALAKRKPERYTTARDMAEDLRHFATNPTTQQAASIRVQVSPARDSSALGAGLPTPPQTQTPGAAPAAGLLAPPQLISDREPLKIVPKGLRSFDASDASFFLDLLPGPRDREGLPESLRFWKTRIESFDADVTFVAGVLYGPSGCGKSSLVKAGLIPHLAAHIVPIYLEASGDETELRLARAIRRACPEFGDDLPLPLLLKNLRRGVGLPSGKKALIVLDQFEQWLHAKRGQSDLELPAALRQCDGERVQCLILVRDDFWLALSRFLEELEIPLLQGRNCAMADLFDPPHARKVLDAFGVAYGKVGWDSVPTNLPTNSRNASPAGRDGVPTYNSFLDQSIAALAEEGKIISVRLALFAEMVKSKPWTPQTLKAIGGVEGVGVTFLEETFSASNAPIAYRTHDKAVRGVLRSLLPDTGTDIKGHMVSRDALLAASGYTQRPRDFETLLHVLDRDLRLITPVDEPGERGGVSPPVITLESSRHIPCAVSPNIADGTWNVPATVPETLSLNRGADAAPLAKMRAQYQLAHDYLVPSIRAWLTKKQKETWRGRAALRLEERSAQWQRTRERRHIPSLFEYTSIVCGVPSRKRTVEQRRMLRAATRHHAIRWGSLLALLVATVFGIERHLAERQQLADDKTVTTRVSVLANATADGVPFTIDALEPLREIAIPKLRALVSDPQAQLSHRLHAAYALATFGDTSSRDAIVTAILDAVPTAAHDEAKNMVIALRQITNTSRLGEPGGVSPRTSGAVAVDGQRPGADVLRLTRNSTVSDVTAKIAERIQSISQKSAPPDPLTVKVRYAALALYLGDASLVALMLQLGPDPTERTAFTLRLKDWPADLSAVRDVLATTTDEPLRSGVVAALGRFPKETISEFEALSSVLQELFETAPDGGTHSAIDWTLRQWNVGQAFQPDPAREQIANVPRTGQAGKPDLRWYTNSAGMTFVEIPAGTYVVGDEPKPPDQARQETFQPILAKTQYEPQLVALEAVLKEKPDDLKATLGRGIAHFHLRHDELAIADLSKIIEKEPTNVFAVQLRAIAHARQKHAEAARADLQQFEELVKGETSTKVYVQVLVASLLGDGKAELAELNRQLLEHATDTNWLYDGACVFAMLGAHATDDAAALKHWDRAIALLQSAVRLGYSEFRHLASDPDLESLHTRAEFLAVLHPKAIKPPERPRVELTRAVYLSNRELSVSQFLAFVNDPNTPAAQKPDKWAGHDKHVSPTDDCPVQKISWFDSVLYCNWLSRQDNLTPSYTLKGKKKMMDFQNREIEVDDWQCDFTVNGYRLPTETEWEVACRAGTTTTWNCGKDDMELREFAVFAINSRNRTWASGTKLPNGLGLFDMHGNVWEWCHDWDGETVPSVRDPQGPEAGSYRVLRGGSWINTAVYARSARRINNPPDSRLNYFGVRLAQVPGAEKQQKK